MTSHTLIQDANDYTTLVANLSIASTGPIGSAVVLVGKFAGKKFASTFMPWSVLNDADQKLQHVFDILDEMKNMMDVKDHDMLHDRYDTLIVTRRNMNLDWRRYCNPIKHRAFTNEIRAFYKVVNRLERSTITTSEATRNANMRVIKAKRLLELRSAQQPEPKVEEHSKASANLSLDTLHEENGYCKLDMSPAPSGPSTVPLENISDLNVVSRLYVYLASRNRNPFRSHDSLIFSEVDLGGVSAEDRLDLVLSTRDPQEEDIIHSMSFEDAFPGNIIPIRV